MEDLTGRQFGPYRVVEPLGEGGMAAVYKGYQPSVDRYVAIKVLPRQLASDAQFVQRFENEAKAIAKLQHPHILPVIDYGSSDEGYTYIVMPYYKSGSLAELLQGEPLPLPELRRLASQLGDALDYAHGRGIIHRDVKPSNVLLDERGNCLLSDFGVARFVEGTAHFTATGAVIGTPTYMSPEQGRGKKVDRRTDIYSLGVVLYEMATGRAPFAAETPIAVMMKHINDPLPPPRSLNPELPQALERIILKCLAKRPEERYASTGEIVRVIKEAIPERVRRPPEAMGAPAASDAQPAEASAGEVGAERPGRDKAPRGQNWRLLLAGVGFAGLVVAGMVLFLAKFPWNEPSATAPPISSSTPEIVGAEAGEPTGSADTTDNGRPTELAGPIADDPFLACQVTDIGGIGDSGFNAIAWEGIRQAEAEFGVEGKFLESQEQSDYSENINAFIEEGCGIIITVGFLLGDATQAAAEANPDRLFSIVDLAYEPPLPNVQGQIFNTDEAAFLAGYLAAGVSETGTVGTFGGLNIPPVTVFMDGFYYGVQHYNEQHGSAVRVLGWDPGTGSGRFAGNFGNIEDGRRLGESLMDEGADIILPVAGPVGLGTAEAAQERGGVYIIGVDSDWVATNPEYADITLTSVLKLMDVTTFNAIEDAQDGEFETTTVIGTLENGGVGLTPYYRLERLVSDDLRAELEAARERVIRGEVRTR